MANYDKTYKQLFSIPGVVADCLRATLPAEWIADLDLDSIERVNGSLVAPSLKGYEADCVWRARSRTTGCLTYFVIEFQRTNEPRMMVRILGYNVFVIEQELKTRTLHTDDGQLPRIINVVVYNGLTRWNGPRTLQELLPPPTESYPELMGPFGYFLVDMSADLNLDPSTLFSHLKAIESARAPGVFQAAVSGLARHLRETNQENLQQILAIWLREILRGWLAPDAEVPDINDFFTMESLLEFNMRSWVQQWKQEGRQEGMEKGMEKGLQTGIAEGVKRGEVTVLTRLLTRRFGSLPSEILTKVNEASTDQLEVWADNFVTADTLEAVFGSGDEARTSPS